MTVKWYGKKVEKQLEAAANEILDEVVTRLGEHTRDNIESNDQIDTGHMRDTVYTVTPGRGSTYSETSTPGQYFSRKTGRMVNRERAPEASPSKPENAIMGVAAPYALFPELQNSFAFRAVDMTDREVPAIVKEVKRRHGLP